mgnify:FL=1
MRKLYTKHYKSKILNTKKLNFNNKIYIGFKIEDLQNIKDFNKNLIDFNLKGLSYINKNNLTKNTLQSI